MYDFVATVAYRHVPKSPARWVQLDAPTAVEPDERFYDAADVDLAASLAGAIRGEYRAAATRAGQ